MTKRQKKKKYQCDKMLITMTTMFGVMVIKLQLASEEDVLDDDDDENNDNDDNGDDDDQDNNAVYFRDL